MGSGPSYWLLGSRVVSHRIWGVSVHGLSHRIKSALPHGHIYVAKGLQDVVLASENIDNLAIDL
jgi:hypothetical protein